MTRMIHIENTLSKIFDGDIRVRKYPEMDCISLDIINMFTSYHDCYPITNNTDALAEEMATDYLNYIFSKFLTKKACKVMKELL